MYYDANNLYGCAMSQYLPTGGFKWLTEEQVAKITIDDIMAIPKDGEIGFSFEVDLDYPKELHDLHNGFPFLPENLIAQEEWLSDYQKSLLGGRKMGNDSKLIATLGPKKNYVLHYRLLQCCLDHGLILTKIHRVFFLSCPHTLDVVFQPELNTVFGTFVEFSKVSSITFLLQ